MSRGHVCINCKEYTKDGHFVTPSLGEEGFFHCTWQEKGPPPKSKVISPYPGVLREVPNE